MSLSQNGGIKHTISGQNTNKSSYTLGGHQLNKIDSLDFEEFRLRISMHALLMVKT